MVPPATCHPYRPGHTHLITDQLQRLPTAFGHNNYWYRLLLLLLRRLQAVVIIGSWRGMQTSKRTRGPWLHTPQTQLYIYKTDQHLDGKNGKDQPSLVRSWLSSNGIGDADCSGDLTHYRQPADKHEQRRGHFRVLNLIAYIYIYIYK